MTVEIKVGALPKDRLKGILTKVSPKAHRDEGSNVFDVEIDLTEVGDATLRAGYSANADIIITQMEDILLIPERLINFENDSAFVETQDSLGTISKISIETGLSDGMQIEVISGLTEGDVLIERPPRQITGD
jgi:HlyD family secretion protein